MLESLFEFVIKQKESPEIDWDRSKAKLAEGYYQESASAIVSHSLLPCDDRSSVTSLLLDTFDLNSSFHGVISSMVLSRASSFDGRCYAMLAKRKGR